MEGISVVCGWRQQAAVIEWVECVCVCVYCGTDANDYAHTPRARTTTHGGEAVVAVVAVAAAAATDRNIKRYADGVGRVPEFFPTRIYLRRTQRTRGGGTARPGIA